MKLMIEATDQITEFDGVPCRVWNGTTETGVECYVLVHRLCVRNGQDTTQFERELQEVPPPRRVPLPEVLK